MRRQGDGDRQQEMDINPIDSLSLTCMKYLGLACMVGPTKTRPITARQPACAICQRESNSGDEKDRLRGGCYDLKIGFQGWFS
jgi:hypothetical protein